MVLVLGAPAFAVFAFSVGVYEATHSQRFWPPIAIGLTVLALSYVVLVHEAIGMSRALQTRLEPVLLGLEASIPLMTPMYPLGVAFRLVELARIYDSACFVRAGLETEATKAAQDLGLSKEQVLTMPQFDALEIALRRASQEAEEARVAFWRFVDMTYDNAAMSFVASTIQLPPRPKKWRDALALGPWIDQARADLYAKLNPGPQKRVTTP